MKGALQGRLLPRRPLTPRRYSAMCRLDKLIQGGSFIQTQPSRASTESVVLTQSDELWPLASGDERS
jgi:hypothetical protein